MMKKMLALFLAVLMGAAMAACSKNEVPTNAKYEGSLEDLMTAIYEKEPVELMLGPATAIDLTNADNVSYFLGLSDADNIEEAVSSEPMVGSQAYSLCLIRAKDGADIDALKQDILDGINLRKWICVGADKVIVTNYGDVIAMIMTNNDLSDALHDAFAQEVGGELGEKLERTGV